MKITKELIEDILRNGIEYLEASDYARFYDSIAFYNQTATGAVTEVIIKALGDPLAYLTYVPEYYLYNSNIENITISDKYTAVGACAFASSALKSLTVDAAEIGIKAFHYCSSLTDVVLGRNVKVVNYRAFVGCFNLRRLHYQGTIKDWSNIVIDAEAFMKGLTVICSDGEFVYL